MKQFCRLTYRIPFSETDAMGIVHHSNHARYFERGRVELLRLIDLGYTEIMKNGWHFPLTDLRISYKRPLQFDDLILIETSVSQCSRIRLNFEYRIFTGASLAESTLSPEPFAEKPAVVGETFHCCVNNQGRPIEIDESMQRKLSALGAS